MTNNSLTHKIGCSICGKKVNARGLCDTHYKQHKRAGTLPERTRTAHMDISDRMEFLSEPVTESGCRIWTGTINAAGYGTISFKNKPNLAHRLSYELTYGEIPEGMKACHKCDTPSCINPNHLFLGTQRENLEDMARKKRGAVGNDYNRSILTDEDVRKIRCDNRLQRVIAEEYGMKRTSIAAIKNGRTWKHVA